MSKPKLKKMQKFAGIKGRWMLSGSLSVFLLIIVAVGAFSLAICSHYYSGMRTGLESKARTASDFFSSYVSRTYAEYRRSAYAYAESFEDKDRIELQFVNTRGRVETSSYGMTAGDSPGTPDITGALETGQISYWTGRLPSTGEHVMAVSAPMFSDDNVIGVMRYVTSLRLVDRQISRIILIAAGVGLLIALIVILFNFCFIRSITEPILELTGVARRIAEGSYGIQVEKKHDDEIGDLTDAINEMSLKISQSEKMQTEFISSVSHELRTPLTAITGWSETLLYDEAIQGDSRRGVEIISKEAERLTKMVVELLEFTRIQDGRFVLNVRPIDIAAELEDSIYTYRELLRQEHIELRYIPPAQDLPMIMGDPERLKQVFLNILDNAAKYGKNGRKIVVAMTLEGEFIAIKTRDYGPGIPENELQHVKKKFYKGSSKERGSGIGLSVCDEIVSRHKGRLEIANAASGGCIVTVYLPIIQEQEYII